MTIQMGTMMQSEKQTGTLTVQYINPPKEGRKMGSVKDMQGNYWAVWPDALETLKPGQTITVDYHTGADGSGRFVNRIHPPEKPAAAKEWPVPENNTGAPLPPGTPPWESAELSKECMIFVTGVVGRAMGSGRFYASDLPELTETAVVAFERYLGKVAE